MRSTYFKPNKPKQPSANAAVDWIDRLLSKLQWQDRLRLRSDYHAVGADSASQKEISTSFLSCDARGSTGGRYGFSK